MGSWQDARLGSSGASLPEDLAAFQVDANDRHISAKVLLLRAATDSLEAQRVCAETAIQLLRRALRLAPASCCCFEPEAENPVRPLMINVELQLRCGRHETEPDVASAALNDAAGLAAAMQQFAAAQGPSVDVSPDLESVIVCRVGD